MSQLPTIKFHFVVILSLFFSLELVSALSGRFQLPSHHLTLLVLGVFSLGIGFIKSPHLRWPDGAFNVLTLLLLIGISASAIMQWLFQPELFDSDGRSTHVYLIQNTLFAVIYFLVGSVIGKSSIPIRSQKSIFIILASFLSLYIFAVGGGSIAFDWTKIRMSTGNQSLSHLSVSNYYTFVIVLAFFSCNGIFRIALFSIFTLVLYSLGSTGAVFSLLCAFVIFCVARRIKKRMVYVALAVSMCGSMFFLHFLAVWLYGTEMHAALYKLDLSTYYRITFIGEELMRMHAYPVYGGAVEIVEKYGSLGSSAHTVVSAWQFYGPVAFFAVIYISFVIVYRSLWQVHANWFAQAMALITLFAVIYIFVARDIHFGLFWLAVGYHISREEPVPNHVKSSVGRVA